MKNFIYVAGFAIFLMIAFLGYNTLSKTVNTPDALSSGADANNEKAPVENTSGNKTDNSATKNKSTDSQADSSQNNQEPEKILAPDFTVVDWEGNEVLLSDCFGKPLVINFWASWCPPCKGEMPEFNKVYESMKDEVNFMMIDLTDGQREKTENGKKYVESKGFTFPVYFDVDQEAAIAYGISSIPTTLFIDKDGYIVKGAQGALDEKTLLKGIGYIVE